MVSTTITLQNEQGFHMRPASVFANAMSAFNSDVFLYYNGTEINGKSVINIIAACMKKGAEIEIKCTGDDEQEAMNKAVEMINGGMGE